MKKVTTYNATIWIGFQKQYTEKIHTLDELRAFCQKYVDDVGLCVTVTPTEFVYTNGSEPGAAVGLINYPRFPAEPEEIRAKAIALATVLKKEFEQYRVSVVFSDETWMLEDND